MKLLVRFYAVVRALLIAGIASNLAISQESGVADQEEADWDQIRREGTAEAFQRYLERYPVGRHASEAFGCSIEAALCDPDLGNRPLSQVRGLSVDIY